MEAPTLWQYFQVMFIQFYLTGNVLASYSKFGFILFYIFLISHQKIHSFIDNQNLVLKWIIRKDYMNASIKFSINITTDWDQSVN